MNHHPATRPHPAPTAPPRPASHRTLLRASRLGAAAAHADQSGDSTAVATAYAAWRQLRRRSGRQARQLLRVAFDTGYGQAMSHAVLADLTSTGH